MSRRRLAGLAAVGLLAAATDCRNPAQLKQENRHPPTYAELDAAQRAEVDALEAAAKADPRDYAANKAAGLRMMDYALSGVLPLQPRAEHYLERAFALRDDDDELLRSLGRFYNMRAVEHDFSKAAQQVRVYRALLGEREPQDMSVAHFVAYSFFMLGQTIQAADEGHMLRAFGRLRDLERNLARRTAAQPEVVELRALAGNFALFFAGYVPVGRKRRLRRGVEHFEYVRTHWSQMRAGARDALRCPNTYENFMFELAEAHLALDDSAQAQPLYEQLVSIRGEATRGKELIAAASAHRLEHLSTYAGRKELMPPWPSDVGNCIVCHAYTGQLPQNTLWIAPSLSLDLNAVPSEARPRPVAARPVNEAAETAIANGPLTRACGECHGPGGRASHLLDLGDPAVLSRQREAIRDAIESGWMPPDRSLSAAERDALLEALDEG